MKGFVIKFVKALGTEFHALAWTLAGTGTVLITLSGDTRSQGIWISVAALVVHLVGSLWQAMKKEDEEDSSEK
jgi:hypothetical protein